MRMYAQPAPLAEPKSGTPLLAPPRVKALHAVMKDEGFKPMHRAFAEGTAQPVQAKAAVDTGYGDLVAAARIVQQKQVGAARRGSAVELAHQGVSGAGGALPHIDVIQRAF